VLVPVPAARSAVDPGTVASQVTAASGSIEKSIQPKPDGLGAPMLVGRPHGYATAHRQYRIGLGCHRQ